MRTISKAGIYMFLVVLCFGFVVFPMKTEAFAPFGGPITLIFPCVNGIKVTMGSPRGGVFMYIPGASVSYAYGPPRRVGQYLLGLSGAPAQCLVSSRRGPVSIGTFPSILFHGSSM